MKPKKAAKNTDRSKSREMVSTNPLGKKTTPEERQNMIAEAAYFRAEHRNFEGGNLEQDWFESEAEINNLLRS